MNDKLIELERERRVVVDKLFGAIKEDDTIVRLYWQKKLNEIDEEIRAIRDKEKTIEKYFYICRGCGKIFKPKEVAEFDKCAGWDVIKPCPNCKSNSLSVIWRSVSLIPQVELTKFGIGVI